MNDDTAAGPGESQAKKPPKENFHEYLLKYNINRRKALLTLMLNTFIDVLGYTLILPLLPRIITSFGASEIVFGLIVSANALTALFFGPVLGKLSDRQGRKKWLIVSMLGTMGSFILLAISQNLLSILLSRVFDGIFSGQVPIIRAYISDVTEKKERSQVMGKMAAGFAMGLILGPAIGGVLGGINWRIPVIFAVGLSALGTILAHRVLIESMPKERIETLRRQREQEILKHGKKKKLFTWPLVLRLAQVFLQVLAFNSFISTLPLVLDERFGASPAQIGALFSVFGIETIIFSAIVLRRLLDKFGEILLYIISIGMMAISFFIYPFINQFWLLFVFITPPTIAMAIFRPLIQTNITKAAHESRQGEANGWGTNMQGLAQVFAPLISTTYLEIGQLFIFGLAIQSYYLIGWTMTFILSILLCLAIIDVKRYHADFEKKKIASRPDFSL